MCFLLSVNVRTTRGFGNPRASLLADMSKVIVVELTVRDEEEAEDVLRQVRKETGDNHPWIPGSVFHHIEKIEVSLEERTDA